MTTIISWNIKGPHLIFAALFLVILVFTLVSIGPFSSSPFHGSRAEYRPPPVPVSSPSAPTDTKWQFQVGRDGENYGLTDEQCTIAFPKLYAEIDKAIARRKDNHITKEELDSRKWLNGMVRGMVYNGELLLTGVQSLEGFYTRGMATLHSLNRALTATTDTLPNIEFTLIVEDFIGGPQQIWTYSKKAGDDHVWIMPDFGYWSWPEVKVGSYSKIRRRIKAVDDGIREDGVQLGGMAFEDKVKKLVWRGASNPNPLRGKLYDLAKGKSWADVVLLNWGDENIKLLPMEDHCKYMFLAQVEGRSYSGRGKYLQNCRSVFVAHKLNWIEAHHAALVASGPEQNYVEVKRDWSDLEATMEHLLANVDEAKRIAENSVATFRDRYLTPAAEACYWRKLIRGWASVSFVPEFYNNTEKTAWRGVPFESFALTGALSWEVGFAAYDPAWPSQFLSIKADLESDLNHYDAEFLDIHHIGSTSIPGLSAKPVLDIMIVVQCPTALPAIDEALGFGRRQHGYVLIGDGGVKGRWSYKLNGVLPARNVYIVVKDSLPYKNYLTMKGTLLRHPALRAEYETVKLALAEKEWDGVMDYATAKNEIVRKILLHAGWNEDDVARKEEGSIKSWAGFDAY